MNHVNAIMGYIGQAAGIVTQIVGWALLLLIAAAVVGEFGVRASFMPRVSGQSLVWLCGCFWLLRGGKIG